MKKLLSILFSLFIIFAFPFSVKANEVKIVDEADVLSEEEESQLESLIADYINTTSYDMAICFMNDDSNDSNIEAYADGYFDYNGYGLGDDRDGIILYVNVSERVLTITTRGTSCIGTYTDKAIEDLYDAVVNGMSNNWVDGASAFVNKAKTIVSDFDYYHPSGEVVIVSREPDKLEIAKNAAIFAFVPSLLAALIAFLIFRGQLKNTAVKTNARQYVTDANVDVFRSGEVYLYTSRSVRRIEHSSSSDSSSSSSRSSTHRSSSGASHGGGGSRHF